MTDVQDMIEDVMNDYLFEIADNKTAMAMANDISMLLSAGWSHDYVLNVEPFENDVGNMKVDLGIKRGNIDDIHITAQYNGSNVTFEELKEGNNKIAYDYAMGIVNE